MVIYVPAPFSFDSTKAVPWNYDSTVYVGDKPMILKEPDVTNIVGASDVTQSGSIFAPEVIHGKASETTAKPTKRKKVKPPEAGKGLSKKTMTIEEDIAFMKVIKKSDYNVIYQINQTLLKISIISLLMSS